MKKIFEVKTHQDFGTIGAIEKGAPENFEPLGGMGIAHDCFEHFEGDTGSIDDEFQAIGCMIHIRLETGVLRDEDVIMEFNTLYNYFLQGYSMTSPTKTVKPLNNYIEYLASRMKPFLEREGFNDNFEDFENAFVYFANKGYRRSQKKYTKPGTTSYIFTLIQNEVDSILEYAQEGDEIIIQYTKTRLIKIEHKEFFELENEY